MLQIPSSVLSLFSFSSKGLVGLFGGFYVGAQITASILLSGLSDVSSLKSSNFRATRTLKAVLQPTKCVPSSSTASFSYVVIVAYVTVMFASLFYILCAKGFCASSSSACGQSPPRGQPTNPEDPIPASSTTSSRAYSPARNHHAVGNQPPSPPPEPGSSGSTDKAPRRIWWLFWALLLIVAFLGFAGIYIYFTTRNSLADLVVGVSPWIQHLSALESGSFWWYHAVVSRISAVKLHIFLHGLHYCKILLLALASHSGLFSIHGRLSRLCSIMANRTCTIFFHYDGAVILGSVCVLASISPLNWVFYAHGSALAVVFITPLLYLSNYLPVIDVLYSLWSYFSLTERSVILGPSILHLATLSVWTAIRGLMGVPSFIRALRRQAVCVHHRPSIVIYFLADSMYLAFEATVCSLPLVYSWILEEAWSTPTPLIRRLLAQDSFFDGWCSAAQKYFGSTETSGPCTSPFVENSLSNFLVPLGLCLFLGKCWVICQDFSRGHLLRCALYHSSCSQASGVNPELAASLNVLFFRLHASVENRLVVRSAAAIGDQKKRSRRRSQQHHTTDRGCFTRKADGGIREDAGGARGFVGDALLFSTAMGLAGDALLFSPPAALSLTSAVSGFSPLFGVCLRHVVQYRQCLHLLSDRRGSG
ncbi:hypothetical protein FB451DRAFT_1444363 [Mycena latifolia]|nr:hypothetical protein FB451DRAFT_1444363 [Mycena latifolia]